MKRFVMYWNEGYQDGPLIEFKTDKELEHELYFEMRWEEDTIKDILDLENGEVKEFWGLAEALYVMRVDDVEDDDPRTFTVEVTENE